jgi:hypothetical protein
MHVRCVHAEEAARLVSSGRATAREGRRVAEIELVDSIGSFRRGPCTPTSIRQYAGQKYTYREGVGDDEVFAHVTQFKYINPKDRKIFLLAVTDCMAPTQ